MEAIGRLGVGKGAADDEDARVAVQDLAKEKQVPRRTSQKTPPTMRTHESPSKISRRKSKYLGVLRILGVAEDLANHRVMHMPIAWLQQRPWTTPGRSGTASASYTGRSRRP